MEWPAGGGRHNLEPPVREPFDVVVGRVCCNAGQAVVEPVPPTHRRVDGRTLRGPPAQV